MRKRGRQPVNRAPRTSDIRPGEAGDSAAKGVSKTEFSKDIPCCGITKRTKSAGVCRMFFTKQAMFDRLSAERTVMSRSTQGFCELRKRGHSPQPRMSRKRSFRKTSIAAESQSGRRPRCVCRMFFSSMPRLTGCGLACAKIGNCYRRVPDKRCFIARNSLVAVPCA